MVGSAFSGKPAARIFHPRHHGILAVVHAFAHVGEECMPFQIGALFARPCWHRTEVVFPQHQFVVAELAFLFAGQRYRVGDEVDAASVGHTAGCHCFGYHIALGYDGSIQFGAACGVLVVDACGLVAQGGPGCAAVVRRLPQIAVAWIFGRPSAHLRQVDGLGGQCRTVKSRQTGQSGRVVYIDGVLGHFFAAQPHRYIIKQQEFIVLGGVFYPHGDGARVVLRQVKRGGIAQPGRWAACSTYLDRQAG